jgi:hypothetical protein
MPVDLNKVPAPLDDPSPPRAGRWLALLTLLLLSGVCLAQWHADSAIFDLPNRLWLLGMGLPLVIWCVLALARLLALIHDQSATDAWNLARDADMARKLRYGRRSLQVLAVSLRTALRDCDAVNGDAQTRALIGGIRAVSVQGDWHNSPEGARHSRLAPMSDELPDELSILLEAAGLDRLDPHLGRTLLSALQQTLADLANFLEEVPYRQPLELLLELDLGGSHSDPEQLWQALWSRSNIRQPVIRLEGHGLGAIDTWLDQRIGDEAMLLVVSARLTPHEVAGTGEAVAALLFGNRLTQTRLPPLAYLHRPQQVEVSSAEAWRDSARKALTWVPLDGALIRHVWLAGKVAAGVKLAPSMFEDLEVASAHKHDLDAALGDLACAAPWVAIAAAVDSLRVEQQPHFIFSTDNVASLRPWCSVVMPPLEDLGKTDE